MSNRLDAVDDINLHTPATRVLIDSISSNISGPANKQNGHSCNKAKVRDRLGSVGDASMVDSIFLKS